MKKWMFVHIMLLCSTTLPAQDAYKEKAKSYVQKYKDLAMAEQQRSGVPACITLGQGILETSAGCSELMTQANNHFGIKCKREWTGETFAHTDDAPNECFRKYKCDLDSYKDHSDYLRSSPRYASLFVLPTTDYKGWATGLKRCGYATNPRYAQQLIKIIEDFNLQEYTLAAANTRSSDPVMVAAKTTQPVTVAVMPEHKVADTPKTEPAVTAVNNANNTVQVNGLKAFYAHKGDVLLEPAMRYKMRYARLLELNDLPDAPLEADMFIYLERKNSKGTHERHILQPGETLLQVAQAEGMQLKQLRALNQLGENEQPAEGTVLQCQVAAAGKPQLKEANERGAMYAGNTRTSESDYITKPVATGDNNNVAATTAQPANEETEAEQEPAVVAAPVQEKKETPVAVVQKETPPPAPVRLVKAAAPAPAPRSVNRDNEPFNIANEKAVEETVVRNNPRYVDRSEQNDAIITPAPAQTNNAPATNSVAATHTEEPATAPAAQPQTAPEPQDELSRLKAKLDRVVYGNDRPSGGNAMKVSSDPTPVYTASTQARPEPQAMSATAQQANTDAAKFYTVQKGDTAFSIAKRNNITMKQLMDWNHLNFEDIKIGQKLRVK
jgi:LysM repeat protein